MTQSRSFDPQLLPDRFDATSVEVKLAERWARDGVYAYDPARPREETFVVDTPPPTVSGSLHIGHVFSFTQPDLIVRYQRMRGRNIYYPMGWDDNGLPTERRVQNYFHVRVDVTAPYDPQLVIEQATPEQTKQPPRSVSRPNFIELCHRVTGEDERAFQQLFTRLGLSVDWRETYATIDDRSRTLAQLSFADLHAKGELYLAETPTLWDVDFQTAIAQAEVEDRDHAGAMHDIAFAVEGGGDFTIATTRPELLAACVGVAAHPDDPRYQPYFGKRAITPCFAAPVPIFPTTLAERDKGTGILMVCTFGDQTDVTWWREQKLPLRQILTRTGRLATLRFGEGAFESLDAERANASYAKLAGKTVKQARAAMVEMLREAGALRGEPKPFTRPVKFFEKGDQPLELIPTRQWFVKLLDKIETLVAQGVRVQWHPPFMGARFENWTRGLQLDWCVSRQRFFGVQIPVWYPLDEHGARDHAHPILAPREMLPIDPTVDVPPGYTAAQREQPNGFSGEADVFDTWFTSSLTPQIASRWLLEPERHPRLFPADVRPQSHEIIRTWAFYTVVKALLHDATIPWHHTLISGWIIDPDRKKMSKSRGNVMTPMHLLDEYTVDGVRYWAASARLGVDTKFDEKVFGEGKRLVTKIFHASKYVLAQSAEVHPIRCELDRAFVAELRELVAAVTADYDKFEYAAALARTERLFWQFTDGYLELVKGRARGDYGASAEDRGSAVATLRLALGVFLRLFAPAMPYVTDEVWSCCFGEERGQPTIHRAPWPTADEFAGIAPPDDRASFELAVAAVTVVNKEKTQRGASVGRIVEQLALAANAATVVALERAIVDIRGAIRATSIDVAVDAALADRELRVASITVAPKT